MLYYIISYFMISYHIISYHICSISYHVMSYDYDNYYVIGSQMVYGRLTDYLRRFYRVMLPQLES